MNSNPINTTKSSEDLKNQVLSDIQKVKDDFKEIEQRLTPGQIIDDAIYFRRGGGDPAKTFAHLKANPIGTSFLTLGTLLLMEDEGHHSFEDLTREKASTVKNEISTRMNEVTSYAKETAGHVKKNIKSKLHRESSSENAKQSAQEGVESVKSTLHEVNSKLNETVQNVRDKGHKAIEASKNIDLLTYLALGAGLGTITGTSLPVSDKEKQVLGSNVEDKLAKFTSELQDALNQSVNILKNEFVGSMAHFDLKLFK